jgi:translocation protein SEC63
VQAKVLLHTPSLLNAYLNIGATRGWLAPIVSALRLQACLTQAVAPDDALARLVQLPGLDADSLRALAPVPRDISDVARALADRQDARVADVRKAVNHWGRVELVDASFRGVFIFAVPLPFADRS